MELSDETRRKAGVCEWQNKSDLKLECLRGHFAADGNSTSSTPSPNSKSTNLLPLANASLTSRAAANAHKSRTTSCSGSEVQRSQCHCRSLYTGAEAEQRQISCPTRFFAGVKHQLSQRTKMCQFSVQSRRSDLWQGTTLCRLTKTSVLLLVVLTMFLSPSFPSCRKSSCVQGSATNTTVVPESHPSGSGHILAKGNHYHAYLYGSMCYYAYYFVNVLVGSPGQRQSVIIDTGSPLLGFPCHNCRKCGEHIDTKYDMEASSTSSWLACSSPKCHSFCSFSATRRCSYQQQYSEGSSIQGYYVSDRVAIGEAFQGNPSVVYDYIGCHTEETNLFITQKVSGIIGMSFSKYRSQPTLMDTLFQTTEKRVFATCIAEDGGVLTIGGYDEEYHLPDSEGRKEIKWVKILGRSTYDVNFTGLRIGDKAISPQFGVRKAIVDSGTTYTYFPPHIYGPIQKLLAEHCTEKYECERDAENKMCWVIEDIEKPPDFFPTLKLIFGDVELPWRPVSYLYYRGEDRWCEGIEQDPSSAAVLGISFFKHKQVIFSRETDQIGFIEARCPPASIAKRSSIPGEFKLPVEEMTAQKVETETVIRTRSSFVMWSTAVVSCGLVMSAMIVIIAQTVAREHPSRHRHLSVDTEEAPSRIPSEPEQASRSSDIEANSDDERARRDSVEVTETNQQQQASSSQNATEARSMRHLEIENIDVQQGHNNNTAESISSGSSSGLYSSDGESNSAGLSDDEFERL